MRTVSGTPARAYSRKEISTSARARCTTIHAQERDASDGEREVGAGEDEDGRDQPSSVSFGALVCPMFGHPAPELERDNALTCADYFARLTSILAFKV